MDLQCVDYQPSRGSAFLWSIVMIFPFLLDGRLSRLGWAVNMKKRKDDHRWHILPFLCVVSLCCFLFTGIYRNSALWHAIVSIPLWQGVWVNSSRTMPLAVSVFYPWIVFSDSNESSVFPTST